MASTRLTTYMMVDLYMATAAATVGVVIAAGIGTDRPASTVSALPASRAAAPSKVVLPAFTAVAAAFTAVAAASTVVAVAVAGIVKQD
jgi:hypothetical protein